MEIFKEFTFEAAHWLPNAPAGHTCRRLHGHSFRVELHVGGTVDSTSGWILDFRDIKKAFMPVYEQLDHRYLNDSEGLSNPTSEHVARWIWHKTRPLLSGLCKVVVRETCTTGCVYTGEE